MLSFVLKSLVVMHHFRAVWMISLCHMLIQKKIIIISSVTEILHINVIQCQLILMKHLGSFLRLTILIYSILNLRYCISSPLCLYSTSVISSCTIWLNGNCWAFFFIHLFIYSFSPLTAGRRDDDKKWNINLRSTVKYMFSQYFGSGTDEPVIKGKREKKWMVD